MFSIFTLHSQTVIADPMLLFHNENQFWAFFFVAIYVIFLQYTFMNLFTAIFFEEQRVFAMFEETIYLKYEHIRRKRIIFRWISGLWGCCKVCSEKVKRRREKGDGDELEAVNNLREKMKQAKRERII